MSSDDGQMTFWDHFDALRGTLWRSLLAVLCSSVLSFIFKDLTFDVIILSPLSPDFFIYRLLPPPSNLNMVNLEVTGQFMTHLRASLMLGFVIVIPYLIWEIWHFIAPALYSNEKKHIRKAFLLASVFFYSGVAVGYFILLPACLSFFQNYIISESVTNNFSIQSYMSLFGSMVVLLGLVFEFPLLITLIARIGIVDVSNLKKGRRYAIVITMIVAAIITPADLGSMIIVAIPLYALYELSILMCRGVKKKEDNVEEERYK